MTTAIMPGAEPFSAVGSTDVGVLVLHGFTGNPSSMRGVADYFANAGYTVELPRLPGHGTTIEDMLTTSWHDWSSHAESVYEDLAARVGQVVVIGLSMGGTLTAWLATRHALGGIVTINGALEPMHPDFRSMIEQMVASGGTVIPGIGSDIAEPGVVESAYAETPLVPLLSMSDAGSEMVNNLGSITCPALVMYSPQDHVVPTTAAAYFAERVGGPVEVVTLDRSFHVATMDYDKDEINTRALAFVKRVAG
jgi:carboxylesterase